MGQGAANDDDVQDNTQKKDGYGYFSGHGCKVADKRHCECTHRDAPVNEIITGQCYCQQGEWRQDACMNGYNGRHPSKTVFLLAFAP